MVRNDLNTHGRPHETIPYATNLVCWVLPLDYGPLPASLPTGGDAAGRVAADARQRQAGRQAMLFSILTFSWPKHPRSQIQIKQNRTHNSTDKPQSPNPNCETQCRRYKTQVTSFQVYKVQVSKWTTIDQNMLRAKIDPNRRN